jgi:hypothetical protein
MLQTHKIISDPFSTHMTSGRTLPWGPLLDFAGEMTYWVFWCSWSNSGQIARRRWYESPEGDSFLQKRFYPRAPRGRGCNNPGAEPTHPEGSKDNAKKIRRIPNKKSLPLPRQKLVSRCQALRQGISLPLKDLQLLHSERPSDGRRAP